MGTGFSPLLQLVLTLSLSGPSKEPEKDDTLKVIVSGSVTLHPLVGITNGQPHLCRLEVCVCVCLVTYMLQSKRSEDSNLWELILTFYYVGPGG